MDTRQQLKIAAIKARIDFCEAERRQLLKMVMSSQVDLAWISERMDSIEIELRLYHRDLEALEKQKAEEWDS
jgi:hypothetical protein